MYNSIKADTEYPCICYQFDKIKNVVVMNSTFKYKVSFTLLLKTTLKHISRAPFNKKKCINKGV